MDSAGGLVRRRASVPDDLALPDDRAEAHRVAAPALGELGDNPEDKQLLNLYASGGAIGRAFIIPPGTQPAALKALQDGFLAMTRDPEFLAEMQKAALDVEPLPAEPLIAETMKTLAAPQSVKDRVKQIFGR